MSASCTFIISLYYVKLENCKFLIKLGEYCMNHYKIRNNKQECNHIFEFVFWNTCGIRLYQISDTVHTKIISVELGVIFIDKKYKFYTIHINMPIFLNTKLLLYTYIKCSQKSKQLKLWVMMLNIFISLMHILQKKHWSIYYSVYFTNSNSTA